MICAPMACMRASRQRARRAEEGIRRSGSVCASSWAGASRMHAQEGLHRPAPPSFADLLVTEWPAGHGPAPLGEIIPRARACDRGLLTGTKVAVVHFAVVPNEADDALDRATLEFEQVLDNRVFAVQICHLRGMPGERLAAAKFFG